MPLVIVVAAFLMFLPTRAAFADGCTDLGGVVVGAECQISSNVGNKSGTFVLTQSLHILDGGKIVVPPAADGNVLTITVCAAPAVCHFVMDTGAEITGSVTKGSTLKGTGATIDITATGSILLAGDGGDGAIISSNQKGGSCTGGRGGRINLTAITSISTQAGSVVSADGKPCPGGAITLLATQGTVTVGGLLSSESTFSGTGALQPPGGGPITVIARCDLTVDGHIRSAGLDAGADLIHLEGGCRVVINGLVESTGGGHGIPNSPPNHCHGPIANPSRPDKPQNSTACIEVWAGDSLVISPTGELNADVGMIGDNDGISWIDLFARGSIAINGDGSLPFSVHANGTGGTGGDGEEGGIVTVKTTQGSVTASGKALQASSTTNGSDGGRVTVEAALAVTLSGSTPTLEAKAKDLGGAIAARAFTGALSWLSGVGDVRPNTTGTISLKACTAISTSGTNFNGEVPSSTTGLCAPTSPTLPTYVVLPACICDSPLPPGVECPEDPLRVLSRTVNSVQQDGLPNHATLSEAVQQATTGEVIGVYLKTTENVSIASKALTITQCTNAEIAALDATKPAIDISSPDPILVIGLDTVGGTVGWLLRTDAHELRGVRAEGATGAGIQIASSGNRVSWNRVRDNGIGIVVSGSGNDLRGGTVEENIGDGVQFSATAQGNVLEGADFLGNGGNGIVVAGFGNVIQDNPRVESNGKNGVLVTGIGNLIAGNVAGTGKVKRNGSDGFKVTGAGNTLDSNKASSNLGDGFNISGGTADNPNTLKGNQSNLGNSGGNKENKGAEYRLANSVKSLDGNKADGANVGRAAKCFEFPRRNKIVNFTTPFVCE